MLDDILARCHEVSEALELVAGHGAVTAALEGQILLEVRIEVLLEGNVAHESHPADAAVELYALKDLCLGRFSEPVVARRQGALGCMREAWVWLSDLLLQRLRVGEGGAVRVILGVGCLDGVAGLVRRSCLVINKISKRQLPSFIERSERL